MNGRENMNGSYFETDFEAMLDNENETTTSTNEIFSHSTTALVAQKKTYKRGDSCIVWVSYSDGREENFHITEVSEEDQNVSPPKTACDYEQYEYSKQNINLSLAAEGYLTYQCKFCKKRYDDEWKCIDHIKSMHNFQCDICQQKFQNIPQLKTHRKVHSNNHDESDIPQKSPFTKFNLKYKCRQCGKHYKTQQYLKSHIEKCTRSRMHKKYNPNKLRR